MEFSLHLGKVQKDMNVLFTMLMPKRFKKHAETLTGNLRHVKPMFFQFLPKFLQLCLVYGLTVILMQQLL